jgi:hypothetical protein
MRRAASRYGRAAALLVAGLALGALAAGGASGELYGENLTAVGLPHIGETATSGVAEFGSAIRA